MSNKKEIALEFLQSWKEQQQNRITKLEEELKELEIDKKETEHQIRASVLDMAAEFGNRLSKESKELFKNFSAESSRDAIKRREQVAEEKASKNREIAEAHTLIEAIDRHIASWNK